MIRPTLLPKSPSPTPPEVSAELGSAIEAAKLRLSAAEEWASTSMKRLESAQYQVTLSKRELQSARKDLEKLEGSSKDRYDNTKKEVKLMNNESGKIENRTVGDRALAATAPCKTKLSTSLPGSAENETICEAAPTSQGEIKRTINSTNVSLRSEARDDKQNNTERPKRDCESVVSCNSYAAFIAFIHQHDVKGLTFEATDNQRKQNDQPVISMINESSNEVSCNAIEVTACGVPEMNGRYRKFGRRDGVSSYSKIGSFEGKESMFSVARWQSSNGTRKWYITATVPGGSSPKQYAFYVAYTPSFMTNPPKKSWIAVVEGDELFLSPIYKGKGLDPVPQIILESDESNINRRSSLGRQISRALMSTGSPGSHRRSTVSNWKGSDSKSSWNSIGSVSTKSRRSQVPHSVYFSPNLIES